MRPELIAASFACVALAARPGLAYERQQHLGLTAGGALSSTDGATGTQPGVDLGLRYTYGVTDAFNLLVDVSGMSLGTEARPAKNVPPQPGRVLAGGVGLAYVFDVTRWVPYAGAVIGPAYAGGGLLQSGFWAPDAQILVGLDYQISRSWSLGGAYSQHMLFTKMSTYPELSTLGLHVDYVWGW